MSDWAIPWGPLAKGFVQGFDRGFVGDFVEGFVKGFVEGFVQGCVEGGFVGWLCRGFAGLETPEQHLLQTVPRQGARKQLRTA